ncbi:hypothetical protein NPIL_672501, partial [Nephila pilipes]
MKKHEQHLIFAVFSFDTNFHQSTTFPYLSTSELAFGCRIIFEAPTHPPSDSKLKKISPVHMMVYWIYTTLFTYTGSGPLWPTYGTNPVCRKYWWWDFFYINNFLSVWYQ